MKNKVNGFTLIELLAVIIILGILMIIMIPSVTTYISDSRKTAYIDTAKQISTGARNLVNSGKLEVFDVDSTYYIPTFCIPTEYSNKSPYGEFTKAFVVVSFNGNDFDYYWESTDSSYIGIPKITKIDDLSLDDIQSNIKEEQIKTDKGLNGASYTKMLNDDCLSFEQAEAKLNFERYVKKLAQNDTANLKIDLYGNTRYISKNPSNYVKFDDSNKIWRIIGVVDGKLKAVDTAMFGNYTIKFASKYDNARLIYSDIDDWKNSIVKEELNTIYYDGLSKKTKSAIVSGVWCIEDSHNNNVTLDVLYQKERECFKPEYSDKRWEGKVASIYVTDYYIAIASENTNSSTSYSGSSSWLYPGIQYSAWRFNTRGGAVEPTLLPLNGGWIGSAPGSGRHYVLPTVFFSRDLYVKSGNGTKNDPYIVEVE